MVKKKQEKIHDPEKMFSIKKTIKKIWNFLWKEESLASYIAFIIVTFVFLRFLFFPVFLFLTGYSDVAAVVSSSMERNELTEHTFYRWLEFNNFDMNEVEEWPFLEGLYIGDVIFVRNVEPEEIEVGDVILFYSGNKRIIHRVVFIEEENGNYFYTTKGDANSNISPSEENIPYELIKGKLFQRVPYLGYPRVVISWILPF